MSLISFDLHALDARHLPRQYFQLNLIRKHQALPVRVKDNVLAIAVAHLDHHEALRDFQFFSGLTTEALFVDATLLQECIVRWSGDNTQQLARDVVVEQQQLTDLETPTLTDDKDQDTPLIAYVNGLIDEAQRRAASDIHFESFANGFRVRCRVDGLLHLLAEPPPHLAPRVIARLKLLAQLDLAERRRPQDGRFAFNDHTDLRVSTLPTQWGEKVVTRLLASRQELLSLTELGLQPKQLDLIRQCLQRTQGLLLVTGPTGSGKSVTLYAALAHLNTIERNLASVEDPIEIDLPGVNQVAVNTKLGLDFATTLRAFLRQDPDVMMVGEIRDSDTADIAIKAAQTGHLVLSTLHTNSAAATLTRLLNIGVAAFNLAASLQMIVAQRLIRRLCEHCKESNSIAAEYLIDLGWKPETQTPPETPIELYQPVGCVHCSGGYRGRRAIFEVLAIDDDIRNHILHNDQLDSLSQQLRHRHHQSLRNSAMDLVVAGYTSIAEALRLTDNEQEPGHASE